MSASSPPFEGRGPPISSTSLPADVGAPWTCIVRTDFRVPHGQGAGGEQTCAAGDTAGTPLAGLACPPPHPAKAKPGSLDQDVRTTSVPGPLPGSRAQRGEGRAETPKSLLPHLLVKNPGRKVVLTPFSCVTSWSDAFTAMSGLSFL